jgi:hypothetical protein
MCTAGTFDCGVSLSYPCIYRTQIVISLNASRDAKKSKSDVSCVEGYAPCPRLLYHVLYGEAGGEATVGNSSWSTQLVYPRAINVTLLSWEYLACLEIAEKGKAISISVEIFLPPSTIFDFVTSTPSNNSVDEIKYH